MKPDFILCDESATCRCDVCHCMREALRAERGVALAEIGVYAALAVSVLVIALVWWIPQ